MSFTAFQTQVKTNSYGPLLFFQAVKPLLEKGKQPRFILLGLLSGSISGITIHPFLRGANEARKAMLNYIMRNMPFEEKGLISFPVEPGEFPAQVRLDRHAERLSKLFGDEPSDQYDQSQDRRAGGDSRQCYARVDLWPLCGLERQEIPMQVMAVEAISTFAVD